MATIADPSRLAPDEIAVTAWASKITPVETDPDWNAKADCDSSDAADWNDTTAWDAKLAPVVRAVATVAEVVRLAAV